MITMADSIFTHLVFPIVGLVTTLSLILTFLNNKKPIHDFKLETKSIFYLIPRFKAILISLYCLSFFLILSPYLFELSRKFGLSSYLFDLCKKAGLLAFTSEYLNFTLLNEVGAIMLFIAIFDTILISFFIKPRYGEYNAKQFFEASSKIVLEGSEDDLASFGKEMKLSFEQIIKSIKSYNRPAIEAAIREKREYKISKIAPLSMQLLDILSDSRFCKIMVTRCSSSFYFLIDQIQKNSLYIYNGGGYNFVRNLFQKALLLQDSILHREKDYDGFGNWKSFTTLAFSDYRFLRGFNIFSTFPKYYDDQLHTWHIEKFTDCVVISLKSSKSDEWGHILEAFGTLESWISGATFSINTSKNPDWRSESSLILRECSKSLRKILETLGKNSDHLPNFKENPDFNELKYRNLYMIVAQGIYDFFRDISKKGSDDEFYRSYSIDVWFSLFNLNKDNKALLAVAKCFEYLLYEDELLGIEDSFLRGYFNGLTLRAIMTISFPYHKPTESASEINLIRDRILRKTYKILYKHFITKYNEKPDFALSYLPKQIEYDNDIKALKEKDWNGEWKIFSLVDNKDVEE